MRVAVVLDERPAVKWQAEVIQAITHAGFPIVDVQLLASVPEPPLSLGAKLLNRLDRHAADRLRPDLRDVDAEADVGVVIPGVAAGTGKHRPGKPDVVIWLAERPPATAATRHVRWGVLRLRAPIAPNDRDAGLGVLPLLHRLPLTVLQVVRHAPDGAMTACAERAIGSDLRSWNVNRRSALSNAATLFLEALSWLAATGGRPVPITRPRHRQHRAATRLLTASHHVRPGAMTLLAARCRASLRRLRSSRPAAPHPAARPVPPHATAVPAGGAGAPVALRRTA